MLRWRCGLLDEVRGGGSKEEGAGLWRFGISAICSRSCRSFATLAPLLDVDLSDDDLADGRVEVAGRGQAALGCPAYFALAPEGSEGLHP